MNSKTDIIPNVAREKIKELEDENDIKLSNLQKVLCSVEGPIARVLDILYGDMNISVLDQHIEKANEYIAENVEINAKKHIH